MRCAGHPHPGWSGGGRGFDLIELGLAAQADAIVTRNLRDLAGGELKFPALKVLTPEQCLEVFPCRP